MPSFWGPLHFPEVVLDYSDEQNDLAMAAIYAAAASILKKRSAQPVILDGRTFLRAYQVHDMLELARTAGQSPNIIECVCADDVAKERLAKDQAEATHPARNRTFDHYLRSKAAAEPLTLPRLTLDTGAVPLEKCIALALAYVGRRTGRPA